MTGTATSAADTGHRCQRAVRRSELRKIVPLADTTIYEMERRGDFPRRFYLTSKCAVWDLNEVEQWLTARREECHAGHVKRAPDPDVRCRKRRQVGSAGGEPEAR
ncbi:MAG: helix-turn-helix transcriptional regulator [Steroidobacteraceae bacterium]